MTKDIEAIKLHNRLNLYMVKTKKFKTDLIGIYIKRHLKKEEAAKNALLTRLLLRGTEQHPSTKALNIHLEESYGMILVSDVVKYGEYHILQFKLQFPDPRHIQEKNIFDKALKILKEVIFNPLLKDGGFDQDFFNQEKEHLIDEINSRVNDKMSYSLERCIECMYEGEAYSEYVYGDEEAVNIITPEALYQHYLQVIHDSLIDICVMGEIESDQVRQQIEETFPIEENDFDEDFEMCDYHTPESVNEVVENFPVKQGKLVMGYHTNICQTDPLYEASVLAYHILGGGATSKLFTELREENSLCYYVYAKSDKFKGCLFIGAGIESENYDLVKEMIAATIKKVKEGQINQMDLDQATESMIASIRSLSDFPNSFINFFYTEVLGQSLKKSFDMEAMIEGYKNVQLQDVIDVYSRLELDTIYFIKGETE